MALYIGTSNPGGATVDISIPMQPEFTGYPKNISITPGVFERVTFPSSGVDDIRVKSSLMSERMKGVRVQSRNGELLTVLGVNREDSSEDAFLALPCKRLAVVYRYFVFSTSTTGSKFLIVPCEDDLSITYTLPGATAAVPVNARRFETILVEKATDVTGTIIASSGPLAVFVGHDCGRMPANAVACDHLVEQIPPHATYGKIFFALPLALRQSGEIFRVGSVVDGNVVNVTCTRRTASGESDVGTETAVIGTGEYHQFRTSGIRDQAGLSSENYRRDFCCIETSKPAIVMQYSLGHSEDSIVLPGLVSNIGDPSMSLVPPVNQYRNNVLISTVNQDVLPHFSFISYAIPAAFFDPATNKNDFLINGTTFTPSSREDMGSDGYIPIHCSNREVCGYGAFSPLASGDATVSYNNTSDPRASFYATVYGFKRVLSFAYPTTYGLEPIGRKSVVA